MSRLAPRLLGLVALASTLHAAGDFEPKKAPPLPTKAADWIGTPPTWESLRGHVVLINVWTFG